MKTNYKIMDEHIIATAANGLEFIVSLEDELLLRKHTWTVANVGGNMRVKTTLQGCKTLLIYRVIMEPEKGMVVDHINGDTLDNRRENLRVCTQGENLRNRTKLSSQNTSGVNGVCWVKKSKKYMAQIRFQYQNIYLGLFDTIEEAAEARREAELAYYGEYAPENTVRGDELSIGEAS